MRCNCENRLGLNPEADEQSVSGEVADRVIPEDNVDW